MGKVIDSYMVLICLSPHGQRNANEKRSAGINSPSRTSMNAENIYEYTVGIWSSLDTDRRNVRLAVKSGYIHQRIEYSVIRSRMLLSSLT